MSRPFHLSWFHYTKNNLRVKLKTSIYRCVFQRSYGLHRAGFCKFTIVTTNIMHLQCQHTNFRCLFPMTDQKSSPNRSTSHGRRLIAFPSLSRLPRRVSQVSPICRHLNIDVAQWMTCNSAAKWLVLLLRTRRVQSSFLGPMIDYS
jgi:hypothetical protein